MIYIGIDDTDSLDSRGTGNLARQIAAFLAADYRLRGVTRHQLSRDPRVPCTQKNSCAAILLDGPQTAVSAIFERVQSLMLADFVAGSDPGLCVATAVPPCVTAFGRAAQQELVTQSRARRLAAANHIMLAGLGGDEDGVIGALAAVGLAAAASDGRYVLVGRVRELSGLQPVNSLLLAGVAAVQTRDGQPVTCGQVLTDKLRPARRNGRPVAIVERQDGYWLPLKLD